MTVIVLCPQHLTFVQCSASRIRILETTSFNHSHKKESNHKHFSKSLMSLKSNRIKYFLVSQLKFLLDHVSIKNEERGTISTTFYEEAPQYSSQFKYRNKDSARYFMHFSGLKSTCYEGWSFIVYDQGQPTFRYELFKLLLSLLLLLLLHLLLLLSLLLLLLPHLLLRPLLLLLLFLLHLLLLLPLLLPLLLLARFLLLGWLVRINPFRFCMSCPPSGLTPSSSTTFTNAIFPLSLRALSRQKD